jgi:hypothetical protein
VTAVVDGTVGGTVGAGLVPLVAVLTDVDIDPAIAAAGVLATGC